jgi:hypothetical protein
MISSRKLANNTRSKCTPNKLLPLEHQLVPVRTDFDFFTRLKLTRQQLCRKRVEQVSLNRAFELARANS